MLQNATTAVVAVDDDVDVVVVDVDVVVVVVDVASRK